MNATEVVDFLQPHAGDPIQMGFLVVMIGMLLFAILATRVSAKPERWERKWNRNAPGEVPGGKLGIEHGSVTDLWNAVATAPEKLSEVMPSLMLVVGLLGTFLGLGLALNHASNILGKPDALSAAGAAGSMNDLVGLLQGLGTKFKTSTWGIIGFILLRIHSELTRHDERRLQWVIGKVQDELSSQEAEQARALEKRRSEQFEKMEQIGARMARSFSDSIAKGFLGHGDLLQRLHRDQALKLDEHDAALTGGLAKLGDDFAAAGAKQAEAVRASLSDLAQGARERSAALREDLADRFSALDAARQSQTEVLDAALQSQTDALVLQLQGMSNDSQATRRAIEKFSQHTGTMLVGMQEGAAQVSTSAKELNKAVAKLQSDLKKVLDEVRDSLSSAIESLGEEAALALAQGSENLAASSARIEEVLEMQSSGLKESMAGIQQSVTDGTKLQVKSTAALGTLTSELSENLQISGQQFSKLGKDILASLRDVSEVGAKMRQISDQLKEFPTTVAEAMIAAQPDKPLPEHLAALRALPAEIARALTGLAARTGGSVAEPRQIGRS